MAAPPNYHDAKKYCLIELHAIVLSSLDVCRHSSIRIDNANRFSSVIFGNVNTKNEALFTKADNCIVTQVLLSCIVYRLSGRPVNGVLTSRRLPG